jgi:hypothetical protein
MSVASMAKMIRQSLTRILQRVGSPSSFLMPCGRGNCASDSIFATIRAATLIGSFSSSFTAERLDDDAILRHELDACVVGAGV